MSTKIINVPNGNNTPTTTAEILIENKIDYTPKVSVIIPVYNVEKYLRQCLDSVVNQTLKEIEIICIDDGSTDSSLEILKEYAEKDPRFTILTQENLYAGIARNAGLSIAKGEYIGFIDPDDWIENKYYEKLYNETIIQKVDIVFQTQRIEIFENKNKQLLFDTPIADNIFEFRYNIIDKNAHLWSKIFNRQFINKYQLFCAKTRRSQDLMFSIPAIIFADSIKCIKSAKYFYRKGHQSICQSDYTLKDIDELTQLYEQILNKIREIKPNYTSLITEKINNTYNNILNKLNNEHKTYFINKIQNLHFIDFNIKNKTKNIIIQNPSPKSIKKIWWGDYWLGLDLAQGLKNIGFNVTTNYHQDFKTKYDKNAINIIMRGIHKYPRKKTNSINILYIFSHFNDVKSRELKKYDIILCSSPTTTLQLKNKHKHVHYIQQFTNEERFFYNKNNQYYNKLIFIGNAYNGCREVVKFAINQNLPISVFGDYWEKYIDTKYIKESYIDNYNLHKYYSNADIVLNDTNINMKKEGFIPNRIMDVTACKGFIISDYIKEIEEIYGDSIPMYKNEKELKKLVDYYLANPEERRRKALKAYEITIKNYTSKVIANQINCIISNYKQPVLRKIINRIPTISLISIETNPTKTRKTITILGLKISYKIKNH